MHPAIGAIFDVGIVAFRVAAIVPIISRTSLWRNLYDLLLLDINRRRCGHRNDRRIAVIRRIPRIPAIPAIPAVSPIPRRIPVSGWIIRHPVTIIT